MKTHTIVNKAKIRHLCLFLVFCLHLVCGAVLSPCRHFVTEKHLLSIRRLIGNQVLNGCSITYRFTDRQNLSEVCYIKAALPHILDLLNTHFKYRTGSDNYDYTLLLESLIYNIYSEKCIPQINEEIEENPVKFAKLYVSLPMEALQKAEQVIQMYQNLMSKSDRSVEWNCEDEYAKDIPDSTTVLHNQTAALKGLLWTRSTPPTSTALPPKSPVITTFRHNSSESTISKPAAKYKASN